MDGNVSYTGFYMIIGEDKKLIGLFGSLYFAGWCLASVTLSRIPDIYGRKKFYIISIFISACFYLGIILNSNLYAMIVLFFFVGLCTVGRIAVGFIFLIEFIPTKY